MRKLRARISPADSLATSTSVGAACFNGVGTFTSQETIRVVLNGGGIRNIRFGKAVIATGGSAFVPDFPGLASCPYHTNASLFNMTCRPASMVVIGAGPISLEMAQAFALFGTKVTVIARSNVLSKEDPDAVVIVRASLEEAGVTFVTDVKDMTFESVNDQGWTVANPCCTDVFPTIRVQGNAGALDITCACILVANGRRPNVNGLGLDAAGVKFNTKTGVEVDDLLRTTNPNIFAVGDVCSKFQFTHVAGTHAQMVVENALFQGERKLSDMIVPWVTFTEPEVAHVGVCEHELPASEECDTYKASLQHNDRAILEGATNGFVKIHCKKGTDTIIGATIVAPSAGEMISELTLAIQFKIPLGATGIGSVIHSYPTVADGVGGCAFGYKMKHWKRL